MASPSKRSSGLSTFQTLRALIKKDWRLFRLPMIALLLASSGCYLIALSEIAVAPPNSDPVYELFDAAVLAIELTGVLAAAFGGMAIAGERADRTGEFIALLPVSRAQIITSKFIVSALIIGGCVAIHLFAYSCFLSTNYHRWAEEWETSGGFWIGTTISFFGIAWLLSTFARSGPISACVSIAITLFVMFLIRGVIVVNPLAGRQVSYHLIVPPMVIGLSSLLAGTLYYLRRVAP